MIALAIKAALLAIEVVGGHPHRLAGRARRRRPSALRCGSIVLALLAARLASRPRRPRRTFGYRRSEGSRRCPTACCCSSSRSPSRSPPSAGWATPRRSTAGGFWRSASSVSPATSRRPSCWPAGARRHQSRGCAAPQPRRCARLARGGRSRASWCWRRLGVVDPVVGLVIAALILASCWRLVGEPLDVLMETAPEGVDVDAVGAAICAEEGVAAVHELHVWTVTPVSARSPPTSSSPRARTGTSPGAGSRSFFTSGSRSTTPRCRWRRRPTGWAVRGREERAARPDRKRDCTRRAWNPTRGSALG